MAINYEDPVVKEILHTRYKFYFKPKHIQKIVSDFIGDDDTAKGRLFDALIQYGINPNCDNPFTDQDGKLFYAWMVIKMDLDDDTRFYIKNRLKSAERKNKEGVAND